MAIAIEMLDEPMVEPPMTDSELVALCQQFEAEAIGEEYTEIAVQQERAINYYYRKMPDLPAEDGSSSVVDGTVGVVIDNALAATLKPFVSADDVVSFQPRGPEDEEQAQQATEYVNYVFNCDNPGFIILHNWFKDALLTKVGIVKTWWEDQTRQEPRQTIVDAIGLMLARENEGYQGEQDNGDGTFTVSVLETVPDGRVKVEVIPPEEFFISPFSRSIDTAPYVAHVPRNMMRADLIAMGFDPDIVESLPASAGFRDESGRAEARYRDEGYGAQQAYLGTPHKSQELVDFREEYIRVDFDGDGLAELRKVMRVGDVVLYNEEADDILMAVLCPVPMPHKVYGVSLADQAVQEQKISTALWRQSLDNLYKANNPRPHIPNNAERQDGSTLDSLADTAPGAAVYEGNVPIRYEAVPFFAEKSFPMLDYVQMQTEQKTGIGRNGQGLDQNALKKSGQTTATEMAMIQGGKNARVEMIARIFAETGVKRLFKMILKLLVEHQPKARMIRLRNKWVEVDPSNWNPDMDLEISVGLGVGDKAEQAAMAMGILEVQDRLAQTPFASMVTEENVFAAVKRFLNASGVKNVDGYVTEPQEGEEKPEKPDPEMMKVQAEMQMKQAEQQAKQQEAALNLQLKQEEAAAKIMLMREDAAAKLELERAKAEAEMQLAMTQQAFEMEMARERMAMDREMAHEKSEMSKLREGGDLDK